MNMKIEILGKGCSKCNKLELITMQAVQELDIKADIHKVKDPKDIANYGVLMTPALVIDGDLLCYGRIPSYNQVKGWLLDYSTQN